MITYRLRGLINLHVFLGAAFAGMLFVTLLEVAPRLGFDRISPFINVPVYLACVVGGMLAGGFPVRTLSHRFHRLEWMDAVRLACRQVALVATVIFAMMAALKDPSLSRLFLTGFFVVLLGGLVVLNRMLPRLLATWMFQREYAMPTLFVGRPSTLATLDRWLGSKRSLGIHPLGWVAETAPRLDEITTPLPFLGTIDRIKGVIDDRLVAQVIVLDMPSDLASARGLLAACQEAGTRVLIYNNLPERLQFPLVGLEDDGIHFFSTQEEPLEDPFNRLLKRSLDLVIALPVVLLVLPPVCVVVAVVQRWQAPGRLFFMQERLGQRRTEFRMYKFRSMFDASRDEVSEARQATKRDARVYPFGRFLRRASLDELPQFINVVKGEMSVVGPRPYMPLLDAEFSRFFVGYRTRHFTKPGITGLAQVRGLRGEVAEHEGLRRRVECDLEYITRWSLGLDVLIVLRTAWHVAFPPKSAY